jgi:translocation and assembly module TamA
MMGKHKRRNWAQLVLALCAMLVATCALAQGNVRGGNYTVRIDAPGPLKTLLEQNLDLERWRGRAGLDLSQLQHLVKVAPEQVRTLVATEGYYSPTVSADLETGGAVPVAHVIVDPGQPTLVGDVDIELQGFVPFDKGSAPIDAATLRSHWGLPVGARFRQADWEDAKRALVRAVMQTRFPRAQLASSQATVDPEAHRAKLKVVVDSGPEMRFGELHIEGLKRYPPSVITNLNKIRPGSEYSEAALQAFQGQLQDTGYFSGVEVSADMSAVLDERLEELGGQAQPAAPRPQAGNNLLPVLVRVTENKQKKVSVGIGYSTNTGGRAGVGYDNLNVLGLRMKSNLTYEQRRQQARIDFYWPTDTRGYNDSFGGGYEREDVNGEITRATSVSATRKWGTPLLERSLTLQAITEQQTVDDILTTRANSVPLTFSITRRALDSLVQPTRGYVVTGQLGAAVQGLLTDESFVRTYGRFIYYHPLGASGTLILRGEAGVVASRNKAGVPASFMFRTGGDQGVRGYGYQKLGVPVGTAIVGGRYLLTGSVEYDYWFKPPWGVAVFYDAGNAADTWHDLRPKVGYGVGARWRSPVGPVGIDVAYGKAVHEVRLHFSLGFTF